MRHSCLILILLSGTSSFAKVNLSVAKFQDQALISACKDTEHVKEKLNARLQDRLIRKLMQFSRFQVQEREIRPLKINHQLVGVIRNIEVCDSKNDRRRELRVTKMKEAQIAIDIQLKDGKGSMTHVFSTQASASSPTVEKALDSAINLLVNELARRIDGAIIQQRHPTKLPIGQKNASSNGYDLQIIRKPAAIGPNLPSSTP